MATNCWDPVLARRLAVEGETDTLIPLDPIWPRQLIAKAQMAATTRSALLCTPAEGRSVPLNVHIGPSLACRGPCGLAHPAVRRCAFLGAPEAVSACARVRGLISNEEAPCPSFLKSKSREGISSAG